MYAGIWAYFGKGIMTNFEFNKEKLLQLDKEDNQIGAVKNGQLKFCCEVSCLECELYNRDGDSCYFNFWKWLASEHIENPKLNKKERKFCELIEEPKEWWLARDFDGTLCLFDSKPWKRSETEWMCTNRCFTPLRGFERIFGELSFSFVKWEDEKPWNVKDLLELEVVE